MNLPRGFLLNGISCGIKSGGPDLGLIFCGQGAVASGFFTKNVNCSYSVSISRDNCGGAVKAVLTNSGNANCFTGKDDLANTGELCARLAERMSINKEEVLIASTGIIGKKLPFKKILRNIPWLCSGLGESMDSFSRSILTTDTFAKKSFRKLTIGNEEINILGICKGAGMIHPEMATMLAFILTDADINRKLLYNCGKKAVSESFNCISVDGCMSTNDTVLFLSSKRGAKVKDGTSLSLFAESLTAVCEDLAKMIVEDGEGATKFVELKVSGARSQKQAAKAFKAIASSLLFRAAIHGSNPNWGRIVASLGAEGIVLSEDKFKVETTPLRNRKIKMKVVIGEGEYEYRGWFNDISPGYIKINAGYS